MRPATLPVTLKQVHPQHCHDDATQACAEVEHLRRTISDLHLLLRQKDDHTRELQDTITLLEASLRMARCANAHDATLSRPRGAHYGHGGGSRAAGLGVAALSSPNERSMLTAETRHQRATSSPCLPPQARAPKLPPAAAYSSADSDASAPLRRSARSSAHGHARCASMPDMLDIGAASGLMEEDDDDMPSSDDDEDAGDYFDEDEESLRSLSPPLARRGADPKDSSPGFLPAAAVSRSVSAPTRCVLARVAPVACS